MFVALISFLPPFVFYATINCLVVAGKKTKGGNPQARNERTNSEKRDFEKPTYGRLTRFSEATFGCDDAGEQAVMDYADHPPTGSSVSILQLPGPRAPQAHTLTQICILTYLCFGKCDFLWIQASCKPDFSGTW